jgi:hypothetical protein
MDGERCRIESGDRPGNGVGGPIETSLRQYRLSPQIFYKVIHLQISILVSKWSIARLPTPGIPAAFPMMAECVGADFQ